MSSGDLYSFFGIKPDQTSGPVPVANGDSLVCQFIVDGKGTGAILIRTLDRPIGSLLDTLTAQLDLPSTLFKAELPLKVGSSDDALHSVSARDMVSSGCDTCFCTLYTRPMAEDTIPTRQLRSSLQQHFSEHSDVESGYVTGTFREIRANSSSEHYKGMKPNSIEWEFVQLEPHSNGWAVSTETTNLPLSALVSQAGKELAMNVKVTPDIAWGEPELDVCPLNYELSGRNEIKLENFDQSLAEVYKVVFGDYHGLPRKSQLEAVRFDLQNRIMDSILSTREGGKRKATFKLRWKRAVIGVLENTDRNETGSGMISPFALLTELRTFPHDLRYYSPEVFIDEFDEHFNDSLMRAFTRLPEDATVDLYSRTLKSELEARSHTPLISPERVPLFYFKQLREDAIRSGDYPPERGIEIALADGITLHLDQQHYSQLSDGGLKLSAVALKHIVGDRGNSSDNAADEGNANQNANADGPAGNADGQAPGAQGRRARLRRLSQQWYQFAMVVFGYLYDRFVFARRAGGGNVVFACLLTFLTKTDSVPAWVTLLVGIYLYVSIVRMLAQVVFRVELSEKLVDWLPPIYRSATSPEDLIQFIPPQAEDILDKEKLVIEMMTIKPTPLQVLTIILGTIEPAVCLKWMRRVKARQRMHISAVKLAKKRADEAALAEIVAKVEAAKAAAEAEAAALAEYEDAFEDAPDASPKSLNGVATELTPYSSGPVHGINPERPPDGELAAETEPLLPRHPDLLQPQPIYAGPAQVPTGTFDEPQTPPRRATSTIRDDVDNHTPAQDPNTSIFTEHLESP